MNKKIAFLFPGQGAQYLAMGKDFFENFPSAKFVFEEANDLLHMNLSKIIFEGPEDLLTKTANSQLAIFITSYSILKVINQDFKSLYPYACLGLSLGEYTALCAAGKISFKDALFLIQKRANFMNEACEKNPGTMTAVLGLDSNIIEEILAKLNPPHLVWAANYNTNEQTVISGSKEAVALASEALKEIGAKKIIPLQVHGAFHSGLMKEAQDKLKIEIEQTPFLESNIKIIMNVCGDYVSKIEEIKKYLIMQVTSGIRWKQSIDVAERDLMDGYIEIGPSKTLTMMNRKNKVKGFSLNVEKISDLEKLSNELR